MEKLRVLVVVPSGCYWVADFATSLISLVAKFAVTPVPGYSSHELRVANIKGSILPRSRLRGLKAAKSGDATHLLFIDSDHTFPPDLLHMLLRHQKDVVAANCTTKTIPACPTARKKSVDPKGELVYSDPDSIGLERVWRVGTGVMLLTRKAFMQIPHDAFEMPFLSDIDDYQGEDWTMCAALEKAGVPIYVDHGVSRLVGHMGMLEYTHDYVGSIAQMPEPVPEGA